MFPLFTLHRRWSVLFRDSATLRYKNRVGFPPQSLTASTANIKYFGSKHYAINKLAFHAIDDLDPAQLAMR